MDRLTTPFSKKLQFWGKKHTIDILFNGKKEVFDIINTGGSLIEILTNEKELCPLIGTEIKLNKNLGKGVQGEVFEITFPDSGTRNYVVKVFKGDLIYLVGGVPMKDQEDARYMTSILDFMEYKNMEGDENSFPSFNGVVLGIGQIAQFELPIFLREPCSDVNNTNFPKGSYLCESYYTEYIIGNLMGRYYRNGKSINFMDIFNFTICGDRSYIFMDEIDLVLRDVIKEIFSNPENMVGEFTCIFIQILHALCICQRNLIVHGDLHLGNIFLDWTRRTVYKGHNLADVKYLVYNFGDRKSLYLPTYRCEYIVKIGDWGRSIKYSEPVIASIEALDQDETRTTFDDKYDLEYFLNKLVTYYIPEDGEDEYFNLEMKKIKKLIAKCAYRSPLNILRDVSMFKQYRFHPEKNEKTVVIGSLY